MRHKECRNSRHKMKVLLVVLLVLGVVAAHLDKQSSGMGNDGLVDHLMEDDNDEQVPHQSNTDKPLHQSNTWSQKDGSTKSGTAFPAQSNTDHGKI